MYSRSECIVYTGAYERSSQASGSNKFFRFII
nr:MAG TPA: hypothetical protein [Caudoviricetes sp.]